MLLVEEGSIEDLMLCWYSYETSFAKLCISGCVSMMLKKSMTAMRVSIVTEYEIRDADPSCKVERAFAVRVAVRG